MSLIGGIINGILGITGALTQQETNGLSLWGTLQAPLFPQFLTNNPLPYGFPWGVLTATGSNPYTSAPYTGVIRSYDFTVIRGQIAPDGYQQNVILINGQFPGPSVQANWGDIIQVTIHNEITGPEEGTAFHWHGIPQKGTPWFDGVPAVQQCPIAPGSSFTYQFQASLYGTTWYHSHYSAQYTGGLLGPMIIHGPKNSDYDIDLGPVFLQDWYHGAYLDIVESVMKSNGNPRPVSDNNLINVQVRYRIDGHNMTVIANDFVPIKPYTTNVVTLGIGQRTDVLVAANAGNSRSSFWMRSNISTLCTSANQPNALAAIFYDQADQTKPPTSTAWDVPDPGTCANDDLSLTVPTFPLNAATASTTRNLNINFYVNSTGSFLWTLDGTSFRANYNNPVLLLAEKGNFSYPDEWNVKNFGRNTTIRIVVNNPTHASHPMHLHGHNMQILHVGSGNWDGVSITNPNNPQRRDVQLVPPFGHFAMQFNADNPGVWPFHCHIAWHVSGGLYANILERPSDIEKDFQIPFIMQETCTNWMAYTNKNVPDQVDSGV